MLRYWKWIWLPGIVLAIIAKHKKLPMKFNLLTFKDVIKKLNLNCEVIQKIYLMKKI